MSNRSKPLTVKDWEKKKEGFVKYLQQCCVELLGTTNEWELLRFKHGNITSVIYATKKGGITWSSSGSKVWDRYRKNEAWDASPSIKRTPRIKGSNRRKSVKDKLIDRDGNSCIYCGGIFEPGKLTIEHFLPLSNGGNNSMANLGLACEPCNQAVDSKSVVEKIKYAMKVYHGF